MIVKRRKIGEGGEYEVAAVADEGFRSRSVSMVAGYSNLPKESKSKPQGEDAHFLCQNKQSIGVADGVGGWALKGVDSGIYARELMTNCVAALDHEPEGAVDPKQVLQSAHSNTNSKGSSTACVLALNGTRLCYANVGDSGFMVFRDNQCAYISSTQQHHFNCPYQLSCKNKGDVVVGEGEFEVESGDVVVLGTDGLLDNLFLSEIEEILQEQSAYGTPYPEQIAWSIAATASANSFDEDYESPFSLAARLAGKEHIGGKCDDITVIVAQIE